MQSCANHPDCVIILTTKIHMNDDIILAVNLRDQAFSLLSSANKLSLCCTKKEKRKTGKKALLKCLYQYLECCICAPQLQVQHIACKEPRFNTLVLFYFY